MYRQGRGVNAVVGHRPNGALHKGPKVLALHAAHKLLLRPVHITTPAKQSASC